MSSVTIRLPFPPSVNGYWDRRVVLPRSWAVVVRPFVGGLWSKLRHHFIGKGAFPIAHTFIGKKGKAYRIDVQAAILSKHGVLRPSESRVGLSVVLVFPDRRTRDIDNVLKALFDSLVHARVLADDSQIDRLEIVRGPVRKPGWLEVTIRKLADGECQPELQLTEPERPF